jgi:sigma-E factor negative regulatory protein RseC
MIEARAIVLRIAGDRAWVRVTDRAGGCGRCDEPGGCRSTKIAYALKAPNEVFDVPNRIAAEAGEAVRIRIADGAPLRGALASYGLGVCLLLVGATVGHVLAPSGSADPYALAGGALGLAAAAVANRLLLRSRGWRSALQVEMVREAAACAHHEAHS